MIKSFSLFIISLLMIPLPLLAQDKEQISVLSLEQAFALALENNNEIQVQTKFVEIADNNVYPGGAGLLPSVNLISDASYQNNMSDITIRTFAENPPTVNFDENGVETKTISATIQADYVFFAGFSGKYRYKLLQNEQNLAHYQQEALINNTVLSVAEIFLEITKLQKQEELLKVNIEVSKDRLKKVKDRFEFGKTTGLAVLSAETDLNQDYNALDEVLLIKNNLIKDLNFLIGLEPEAEYKVTADYKMPVLINVEETKQIILQSNPELKLSQENINLSNNQLSLSEANLYPRISSYANYGYFWQSNDVQQLSEIQNLGFTVGISVRYNLFNGKQTKREIQNVKLSLNANQIQLNQLKNSLINQAIKEQSKLSLLQNQLNREEKNLGTFQESFERTQERYFNGKATSLEVRDVQTALLNAKITMSNIQIDMLKSALRLEKLKGTLL